MDSIIQDKLLKDIQAYCKLNELDTAEFVNSTLREEFMKKKWGAFQPNQPEPKKEPVKQVVPEKVEPVVKPPQPTQHQTPQVPKKRDLYGE